MADALRQRLDRIESKTALLRKKIVDLRDSHNADMSRISNLEKSNLMQNKEIEKLNAQVQYLSLSHTIAPKTEEVLKSRDILAQLVREIDRCIADIGY
ncbi:MAG: hypothetical protein K2K52_07840 [Paramuribaculum sp.]|nr:hypothetical protein [Paramuribaculum sp.]MDE6460720.1 hypothetical protein [Paramuribaculum sp.]